MDNVGIVVDDLYDRERTDEAVRQAMASSAG
jgi:hypothetical protein